MKMFIPHCLLILIYTVMSYSAKQPNIVIILADDLGFNDVSHRGSDLIPTPNIDALAYSGILLNRHYVFPACTPSRSALMTGYHPLRYGAQGYPLKAGEVGGIPSSYKLLPQYLKELGYYTHLIGKWHVGYSTPKHLPFNRGFDSFLGYFNGYIDYYMLDINQTVAPDREPFRGYDFHDEKSPRWDLKGKYATDIFTDEAIRVIEEHDENNPLFLCVTHLAVHTGTTEEDGMQPPRGVDPDESFSHIENEHRRRFATMVSALDESVGKIFRALSRKKILDNTVFLFMADNGASSVATEMQPNYGSNWPLRGVKFTLFEGGVRGAAVIWSPLLPKQSIHEGFIHITDWLPTFVAAAGGDVSELDGKNQWDNLRSLRTETRRDFLLNIDSAQNTEALVLNGRWKVIMENNRDYGNYDFHYRVQNNSDSVPEVTPEKIRKSIVGKIIEETYDISLSDDALTEIRNKATIPCEVPNAHEMGWVESSKNFYCQNYCVFDIINDPCEINKLNRSDLIEEAKETMVRWKKLEELTKPGFVDERSNPSGFNNVWSPWIIEKNSSFNTYLIILAVCLFLSLLCACNVNKKNKNITKYK